MPTISLRVLPRSHHHRNHLEWRTRDRPAFAPFAHKFCTAQTVRNCSQDRHQGGRARQLRCCRPIAL